MAKNVLKNTRFIRPSVDASDAPSVATSKHSPRMVPVQTATFIFRDLVARGACTSRFYEQDVASLPRQCVQQALPRAQNVNSGYAACGPATSGARS
jgi:hypothetical protein